MQKAQRLYEGDTAGLICPAGPVREYRLESGITALKSMGLRVKLGAHVRKARGYLAGTDSERACDINKMFQDPHVKAIFCVRGGFGSSRVLELLNYDIIRQNPKVFVGYSDITALHLSLERRAGLVTFHGPMAAEMTENFPLYNRRCLERAIFCPRPLGELVNPEDEGPPVELVKGSAMGPLKGGNLSLICSTLGTPYEINTKGSILFLEEIGEPPYRVDRMLTHLRMAGKTKDAAALVFGRWKGCTDENSPEPPIEKVLEEFAKKERKPCISNVMIGHDKYNITVPLNCCGLIEDGRLYVTENGVL